MNPLQVRRLLLVACTICNLLLSFWQFKLIVSWYGASIMSDMVFASIVLPQLIAVLATYVISNACVPVLASLPSDNRRHTTWHLFFRFAAWSIPLLALLYATSASWVPMIFAKLAASKAADLEQLVHIQILGCWFIALSGVQWSLLKSRGEVLKGEFSYLVSNTTVIALMMALSGQFGLIGVTVAIASKYAVQVICLMLFTGLPSLSRPDRDGLLEIQGRMLTLFKGAAALKLTMPVERVIASLMPPGGLTLFLLAQQCVGAVEQLISRTIITSALPRLSKAWDERRRMDFRQLVRRDAYFVAAATSIFWVVLYLVGEHLLRLAFESGQFGGRDISTLHLLVCLLIGQLVVSPTASILNNAFYSTGLVRTPLVIGASAAVVGIMLRYFGVTMFGLNGLALAVSAQYLIALFALLLAYRQFSKRNFLR